MRAETRSWVRRAQALVLICAVFIYIILIGDTEFLAEAGIARVDGPWMRRIAISRGIFILVCLALILVAFRLKLYTKEAFGFVAVSSVVNLRYRFSDTLPTWIRGSEYALPLTLRPPSRGKLIDCLPVLRLRQRASGSQAEQDAIRHSF